MRHILKMSLVALAGLFVEQTASAQQSPPASPSSSEGSSVSPASPSSEGSGKKIGLGADLQFGLPVGDLADATGPQIGILLRGGYRIIPPLELTLRIGYLLGLSKTLGSSPLTGDITSSLSNIPIWAGARYFVLQPDAGLYAGAEIGANVMMASFDAGAGSSSKTEARFGFNLGVGYVISPELPIDIRAQFSMLNLIGKDNSTTTVGTTTVQANESSLFMLGLSVGYTFSL